MAGTRKPNPHKNIKNKPSPGHSAPVVNVATGEVVGYASSRRRRNVQYYFGE